MTTDPHIGRHEEFQAAAGRMAGYRTFFATESSIARNPPRDSIVIVSRSWLPISERFHKSNVVIFDMRDNFLRKKAICKLEVLLEAAARGFVDGVVYSAPDWKSKFGQNTPQALIPHPRDPRYKKCTNTTEFKPAVFCYKTNLRFPETLTQRGIDIVAGERPTDIPLWIEASPRYNCHIDLREPDNAYGRLKPNSKLATAVACDAVFVSTQTGAVDMLLPRGYPYIARKGELFDMVERARSEFGGPVWKIAQSIIRSLYEPLSPLSVVEEYLRFATRVWRTKYGDG